MARWLLFHCILSGKPCPLFPCPCRQQSFLLLPVHRFPAQWLQDAVAVARGGMKVENISSAIKRAFKRLSRIWGYFFRFAANGCLKSKRDLSVFMFSYFPPLHLPAWGPAVLFFHWVWGLKILQFSWFLFQAPFIKALQLFASLWQLILASTLSYRYCLQIYLHTCTHAYLVDLGRLQSYMQTVASSICHLAVS